MLDRVKNALNKPGPRFHHHHHRLGRYSQAPGLHADDTGNGAADVRRRRVGEHLSDSGSSFSGWDPEERNIIDDFLGHGMHQTDDEEESDDEDASTMDRQHREAVQECVRRARTQVRDIPGGNLYRGWAVRLQRGTLFSQLRLITVLVIAAQIFAPLLLNAHFYLVINSSECIEPIWNLSYFNVPGARRQDSTDLFNFVILKFVGVVFLSVLYINADVSLKKQDRDHERLQLLMGNQLKRRWMVTDAFVNSWVVALCALALPAVLWTAGDVKELVLDAFGLIFLYNLDDLSDNLTYEVEDQDFDALMIEIESEVKELLGNGEIMIKHMSLEQYTTDWEILYATRIRYGDIMFELGRTANFFVGSFAIPAYFFVFFPDGSDDGATGETSTCSGAPWSFVFACGFVFISLVIAIRCRMFWRRRWGRKEDSDPPRKELKWDFMAFVLEMLPRGEDVRVSEYRQEVIEHFDRVGKPSKASDPNQMFSQQTTSMQ